MILEPKGGNVDDYTATGAELGSTADLALVQWKPWERETQDKNKK